MDAPQRSVAALRTAYGDFAHGIYLGEGPGGHVHAGAQRSTLVLGPSRSGKTSSLVIPNLMLSGGPVVSTSTKPDVMQATAAAAAAGIPVFVTGGVTPEKIPLLARAGVRHFVVVRYLTEAADPRGAALALRDAVDTALEGGVGGGLGEVVGGGVADDLGGVSG